ncbi:MAG: endonuclease/exonuclease/phosphatase family protein [Proteobacteria bacterium]|jgi:hypothetical protein|nr:endonuclease/exonuclease/phosphatase family protein [Pseudomonadota bacterium]
MRTTMLACVAICGCTPQTDEPIESPDLSILAVATQNAGTTPFLDGFGESPMRDNCDVYYCNDLCSVDAESVLAQAITDRQPDILMLEEVWDQRRCSDADRPTEVNEAPYACSAGDDHQLSRILAEDYYYACSDGIRETQTCVTFRSSVFSPLKSDGSEGDCDGRNCSQMLVDLPADCEEEGTMAYLRGKTAAGQATTLMVMHLYTDFASGTQECRASQLQAAHEALLTLPEDEMLLIAGDFNLDPDQWEGPDIDALQKMVDEVGLVRLPTEGPSHMILDITIDLVFHRGWALASSVTCETVFLDEDAQVPMIDHAMIDCQ